MSHAVTQPSPPFAAAAGALEVHQVPVWQDNLSWIVVCRATREAAVVDGPEAGPVLDYAARHELRLRTILNTHTHPDHVGINAELLRDGRLEQFRVVGPAEVARAVPGLSEGVGEGSRVRVGAVEGRVLSTPGHLDGHVSYVFEDVLFCGDTLFTGGCGYLFDGPAARMHDSLERLAALDGHTFVCCAHEYTQDNLRFAWSVEPENEALAGRIRAVWALRGRGGCAVPSTIEVERATNPFLRHGSADLRRHVSEQLPGAALERPVDVFTATRALKDRKRYRELGDDRLPLAESEGGRPA